MTSEMQQITAAGRGIEEASFATIDREAGAHHFSPEEWPIVRRVIHATADFDFKDNLVFHSGAVAAGIDAIRRGAPVVVDVEMIRAGLSQERLARFRIETHCFISDPDVIAEARRTNSTRAVVAMRRARELLQGGIVAVGNAPTALLEIARMVREEGVRPALVIAVPVGFVNAVESKEAFLSLDVPAIIARGRKGGSTIAVAIIHALLALAIDTPAASGAAAATRAKTSASVAAEKRPTPKVCIVGVGSGGADDLSARALRTIASAELLCGGERHLALFPSFSGERFTVKSNLKELADLLASTNKRAVVLASGDPNFYGIGRYLTAKLGKEAVDIVPAPSSMQEAFARIKEPWDDAHFVSFHGRELDVGKVASARKVGIFTDEKNSPQVIARALLERGLTDFSAWLCENLGAPNEQVRRFSLAELAEIPSVAPLNILILLREG